MWGNEGPLYLALLGGAFGLLLAAMAFNLWRRRAAERALQKARALAQAGDHASALGFFLKAESLWRFHTHEKSFAGKAQDLDRLCSILQGAQASARSLRRSENPGDLEQTIAQMKAFFSSRDQFGWDGRTESRDRAALLRQLEHKLDAGRREWRAHAQREGTLVSQ